MRAHAAVGGQPRFVERGEGAYIFDIDDNRYLDLCGSWGPLILGHAHPEVTEAIARAATKGSSFGAPTPLENDLAEMIVSAVASIERVRFTSSGTEAAMSAVRLARGATGRDKIVKMAGCYHGHADALLVEAGSGVLTQGIPGSAGVTERAAADTIVVPFNDASAVEQALSSGEVAAVIAEPIAANMGVVPPRDGYLQQLRELTSEAGSLLIFDEVVTGFRVAWGGAQHLYGVAPDITILGKIIGGGMPLAAYGASSDLMAQIAPEGPVYQAGTLSGNPVSVAAGLATLRVLQRENPYARLEELGARIEAAGAGPGRRLQRVGSMLTVHFRSDPVLDLADARSSDEAGFAAWFQELLAAGIWWPPSRFEAAFLNTAMTDADVRTVIEHLR